MRRSYKPMLLTLIAKAFDDPNWIFEPKYDGLRVLARVNGRTASLISRNNKSQNLQFPEIEAALLCAVEHSAVLDGEIVCLDDHGRSTFRKLQQRFHVLDPREIQRRARQFPVCLYLFDVLYWDGFELTSLPLEHRKQILSKAVRWSDRIRMTPSTREHGVAMFRGACKHREEGIVGKNLYSPYLGARSKLWIKVKCVGQQEFVIGGWTDPQRSRVGIGALLIGYFDRTGSHLVFAGKVGTGFDHQTLLELRQRLSVIGRPSSPFDHADSVPTTGVHWVQPHLVAQIAFAEWTQNGLLRQPRYEGLRIDKKPRDVRRERPTI